MKWATKKSSSSSLINRVFPVSWFSKFKKKGGGAGDVGGGGDHDSNSAKLSSNTELNRPSPIPSRYRRGRFYSMDEDDAFWRISFGGDSLPPRRSCGGANDHENRVFSEFTSLGLGEGGASRNDGECRNFSEMVSDVRKMREKEVRETKDVHLKEIKTRSESHLKRRKENSKANSPRTELRIRALEKMKRRAKKERFDSVFDSFAVVKSSVDPQRDFKDSMVEMIREKGIGHPDELEQLLACYLTLNCDEYHDLIISVFRQVWIEEKGVY